MSWNCWNKCHEYFILWNSGKKFSTFPPVVRNMKDCHIFLMDLKFEIILGPAQWLFRLVLHLQHQYPIWTLVQVLAALQLIQLPVCVLGNRGSPWDPTPMGDPEKALRSWLQICLALTVVAFGEWKRGMEDLSLFLSVSPFLSDNLPSNKTS